MDGAEAGTNGRSADSHRFPPCRKERDKGGATSTLIYNGKGWASPQLGRETVLAVNNLSQSAQAVELDLSRYQGCIPIEMFGKNLFPRVGSLPYLLTLGPSSSTGFACAGSEDAFLHLH